MQNQLALLESAPPIQNRNQRFDMGDTTAAPSCANCKKTEEANGKALLRCASCHIVWYCDKDCQKAHWKSHKGYCTFKPKSKPAKPTPTPLANQSAKERMETLFGIDTKGSLQHKPEVEVYKLLVDSFRMRVEDEYTFRGEVLDDSAMGEGSPARGFGGYLKKAEKREGLLPAWWGAEKREACVKFGGKRNHWWSLHAAPEKAGFQEQYGDSQAPMRLRMLGEEVVGSYVCGDGPGL